MPFPPARFRNIFKILSLMLSITAVAVCFWFSLSCDGGGGGDDDDDDDDNDDGDDDDDVSDEDKAEIACRKIDECGFTDDLDISDCDQYAGGLSDWLMQCALGAKGCGDLAECFNIPEGQ
jgi:hypothetical protein